MSVHEPDDEPVETIAERRFGPRRSEPVPIARTPSAVASAEAALAEARALEELVQERLEAYVAALKGHLPTNLYGLIMPQLERPLIRVAMALADGRQSIAATMLGIHRNTLRAKIRDLGLEEELDGHRRRDLDLKR